MLARYAVAKHVAEQGIVSMPQYPNTESVNRKTMMTLLVVLLMATAIGSVGFFGRYFYEKRPRQPDFASGQIYPQTLCETRVYLTRAEKLPFEYFWVVIGGFIWTGFILQCRRRRIPRSKKGKP